MFDAHRCLTRACTASIDIVGPWQKNNYCEFAEAKCRQCLQIYWYVWRDKKYSLHYRTYGESFDSRRESHAAFRVKQKGNKMTDVQVTLSLDDIVDIVMAEQSNVEAQNVLVEKEALLEQREREHIGALSAFLENKMLDITSGLKEMFGEDVSFDLDLTYVSADDTEVGANATVNSEFVTGDLEFDFSISDEELNAMPTYVAYTELLSEIEDLQGQFSYTDVYNRKKKLKDALVAYVTQAHNSELLEKAKEISQDL